ncbi:unnamed protein product [Schistosoma curassoni]|uniref:Reverse transcriptase domain-containing protein n=1 Tax=Schistosoma curassoni TaxID=6186 RepID=A0A183KEP6_9TREM|nr:unnamed protein product [Schistosoma curassoni]
MKTSTSEGKHKIQWTSRMQLDDLDFADDLALLSQTHQQMQEKTTRVAAASAAVGLNIHKGKSRVLRYNTACTNPIKIDGDDLEDVKTFTYMGSIIDEQGRSDADVKVRIGKARTAYLQLKNIWNSKQLSTNTKQQPTLVENKADPSGGRNQEEAMEVDRIHTLRKAPNCVTRQALTWNPQSRKGKRKAKEDITPGSGNRHEKNEQELDGARKEGPGQRTISLVAPQAIIYMTDSALITPSKSDGTESLDNNSLRDN